jgi:hypothetical protein
MASSALAAVVQLYSLARKAASFSRADESLSTIIIELCFFFIALFFLIPSGTRIYPDVLLPYPQSVYAEAEAAKAQ